MDELNKNHTAACPKKLRILCLHGYRQNAKKFNAQIASLKRSLKSMVEMVVIDAPYKIPYSPTSHRHKEMSQDNATDSTVEHAQYAWWEFQKNNTGDVISTCGVEEGINFLKELWKTKGPFDGVLGFSQGGTCASLLAELNDPSLKLNLPSLHIMGTTDQMVSIDRSQKLASFFDSPVVIVHEGGHYVPCSKEIRDQLKEFIQKRYNNSILDNPCPDS